QRPLPPGQHFHELVMDLVGVFGAGEPEPLGDPEDVGVHGDRRLAEGISQDDVGRLEADPRQRRQRVARPGNLAPVALDQRPRHADDRARLRAKEARRVDQALERPEIGLRPVARRPVLCEERGRHPVHALVCALGGQDRRDQELERVREVEGDLRVGIGLLERADDLPCAPSLRVQRFPHRLSRQGPAATRMASGVISTRPTSSRTGSRLASPSEGSYPRTTQSTSRPGSGTPPTRTRSKAIANGRSLAGTRRTRAVRSGPGCATASASASRSSVTDAFRRPLSWWRKALKSAARIVARSILTRPAYALPGFTRRSSIPIWRSRTRARAAFGRVRSPTVAVAARSSTRAIRPRRIPSSCVSRISRPSTSRATSERRARIALSTARAIAAGATVGPSSSRRALTVAVEPSGSGNVPITGKTWARCGSVARRSAMRPGRPAVHGGPCSPDFSTM